MDGCRARGEKVMKVFTCPEAETLEMLLLAAGIGLIAIVLHARERWSRR